MSSNFDNFGTATDRELGWDEEVTDESPEFVILPEGDYEFTVGKFERSRFEGSPKVQPCNQAIVWIDITTPEGIASIRHSFFLLQSKASYIGSFFRSLGMKKENEPVKPDWQGAIGKTGKCKVSHRTYNDKTYNQVSRFYAPDDASPSQGKFGGSF